MLRSDYNKGILRLVPTVCLLCAVAEIIVIELDSGNVSFSKTFTIAATQLATKPSISLSQKVKIRATKTV